MSSRLADVRNVDEINVSAADSVSGGKFITAIPAIVGEEGGGSPLAWILNIALDGLLLKFGFLS